MSQKYFFLITLLTLLISYNAYSICTTKDITQLRKTPSLRGRVRWTVYKYTPLKRIQYRKGWYKVQEISGKRSWIHRKDITKSFKCAIVKVYRCNKRLGPGTEYDKSKLKKQAFYGDSFRVLTIDKKKNWAKLKDSDGDIFWIFRPFLWIR